MEGKMMIRGVEIQTASFSFGCFNGNAELLANFPNGYEHKTVHSSQNLQEVYRKIS
jgi:hypothetical protein